MNRLYQPQHLQNQTKHSKIMHNKQPLALSTIDWTADLCLISAWSVKV